MATTQDIHAPTLGSPGGAVRELRRSAGRRPALLPGVRGPARRGARLPSATSWPPAARRRVTPAAGAAVAGAARGRRRAAALTFLAGLLCLLRRARRGVLIGDSGDDGTARAPPPPQVITVGGAAAAPAAHAGGHHEHAGALDVTSGASGSAAKSSKGAKARRPRRRSTGRPPSNKTVKDLNSSSGADYQKKSQKLPKQVGTVGKPPPKDNKPAGGGSGFQEIG